jgi:lipoyl(octanoyl) transferase
VKGHTNKDVTVIDLGLIDYQRGWDKQKHYFDLILEAKKRSLLAGETSRQETENFILICQHPHVFTLGKSGNERNLLIHQSELERIGATFCQTSRGGDITYHGPGQLVVYPIVDLENFFTDIHRYMRLLEEAVIRTLAHYKIEAGRIEGLTGVWLEPESNLARKICAMGVKTSRWVTMHGLALNVDPDLSYFDYIIPCGIGNKSVTSMKRELGRAQNVSEVSTILTNHLIELFGMTLAREKAHD